MYMLGYLDAGTGGMIVAAVVAVFAAMAAFFRTAWYRLLVVLRIKSPQDLEAYKEKRKAASSLADELEEFDGRSSDPSAD